MAYVHYDRISETTTTSGTADLVVSGALPGARPWSTLANGEQFVYCLEEGTSYEIADGTWVSSTSTITRGTLHSSTTGAKLNLTGSGATVMLIVSSKWIEELEASIAAAGPTYHESSTSISIGPSRGLVSGSYNASMGWRCFYSTVTGNYNTGFGGFVGADLTSGSFNSFLGYGSGKGVTTGSRNVRLGYWAGQYLGNVSQYLAIGWGMTAADHWLIGDDSGDLFAVYNFNVAGVLTANGLAYPSNASGSVGQALGKTADGTIGFIDVSAEVPQHIGHRLSLAAADAFPQANQTAKTDLYLLPFRDNLARLYDGSAWQLRTIASLAFDITTDTDYDSAAIASGSLYDVFIAWNSGTHKLVFKKWTSSGAGSSTRATALTKQDGVDVLSGATDHVFIGTVYVNGSTNLEDSTSNRYVGNLYNAQPRAMSVDAGTVVHSWSGGVRPWNNNTALRMNFVCPEVRRIDISGIMGTIDSSPAKAGAAIDSTTSGYVLVENRSNTFHRTPFPKAAVLGAGFHYVQLVEDAESSGSGNFYEIKGEVNLNL